MTDDRVLRGELDRLAHVDRLLVATDFDGTLAPIVADPAQARALPHGQQALADLAELSGTTVAVISGRSRDALYELTDLPAAVHLVGSHGMEFDETFAHLLTPGDRERLHEVSSTAASVSAKFAGIELEHKPASVAIHYRHVPEPLKTSVVDEITRGPGAVAGVEVTAGKQVLEVAVIRTSKGDAIDRLKTQSGATAVIFIGDDVTDEKAFARLGDADLAVKVGPGDSVAALRIADPAAVGDLLAYLATARRTALG